MPAKFGTSGLRGLVGELTDGTAAVHVRAFLEHLKAGGRVAAGDPVFVGQDFRPSSPELAAQCMAAIEDADLRPVDCGELPTPALALHAMVVGAASVMVTGSHIPADRNGVKFYRPDGEIDKTDEAAISACAVNFGPAHRRATPHRVPENQHAEATERFRERYAGLIPEGSCSGKRFGVYQHSTVARDLLVEILAPSGAEIVPLGHSDTFVPVDTEAVDEATRERIRIWIERHELDALVSADGDGDRPLLAGEDGECLRGDVLGLLSARYLDADFVVTPVTSNSGIEAALDAKIVRTRVGSPFVIAGMEQAAKSGGQRIIGFEANGGVLTGSPLTAGAVNLPALPTRDCMLPILGVLAASLGAGKPLSSLVGNLRLPVAANGLIRDFPSGEGRAFVSLLSADEAARAKFLAPIGTARSVDLTDGLRMMLADGTMLHLRPSGNAPEMRVYAEAATEAAAEALIAAAIARIGEWRSA